MSMNLHPHRCIKVAVVTLVNGHQQHPQLHSFQFLISFLTVISSDIAIHSKHIHSISSSPLFPLFSIPQFSHINIKMRSAVIIALTASAVALPLGEFFDNFFGNKATFTAIDPPVFPHTAANVGTGTIGTGTATGTVGVPSQGTSLPSTYPGTEPVATATATNAPYWKQKRDKIVGTASTYPGTGGPTAYPTAPAGTASMGIYYEEPAEFTPLKINYQLAETSSVIPIPTPTFSWGTETEATQAA
ncbi:hypothetical protein BU24DRAFT_117566 [Aaosphaeria arxii CBS 175.79]|uniref:Uncharacterized protein n=1 Tax=Aaosphaeria arxii CBS 175.79 TaxID=1450172 RepID=A0A6A5Y498_9PLEO|nr:uncharacterized protein BU24DRAFT_117566 [Aaosphaeria arxii CBS 175.79]KAF2019334.1 hypothetical protein BU24DRAFT_117566 [Aaosphaeria arxii CBS 175.79]